VHVLSFALGAATFVVSNVVLFIMAYPTMPNPGPQADIRLPLFGLVAIVILISFLLRKTGVAFGAGFASGFLFELLFMSGCTTHWADPGGTALMEARTARRVEAAGVEAEVRSQQKWMDEVRSRGLDLGTGVHRLEIATGCLLDYRAKHDEYPAAAADSLPDWGDYCWKLRRTRSDETGWRILYSPIAGDTGRRVVGFWIRSGPDAALRIKGPLLEVDHGIFVRRDSAGAPAFAVGSPLQPITAVVMECIRKNSNLKPESKNGVMTLRHLVLYPGHCSRLRLQQVKTESGYVLDDPNIARLYLPTTRELVSFPLEDQSTAWDLTYVPHGKTPADGYDLHVRPITYGFTGIRSYLLSGGEVHVTWENRRASLTDPLAEPCEMDPWQACGG
jgi:hypothetical protein